MNKYLIYKILKNCGVVVTAGSIYAAIIVGGVANVCQDEREKIFDKAEHSPQYVEYFNEEMTFIYSLYKSGKINASEYNERRIALASIDEIDRNGHKFMTAEDVEVFKKYGSQAESLKSALNACNIETAIGIAGVGAATIMYLKNKKEFDTLENEK